MMAVVKQKQKNIGDVGRGLERSKRLKLSITLNAGNFKVPSCEQVQ